LGGSVGARLRPYERLTKGADYQRVLRQGARSEGRFFVLVATPNSSGFDRLGVVASRRLGTAAVRNRAKRLLREAFRRNKRSATTGWDVILIGRAGLLRGKQGDVERDYRERREQLPAGRRAGPRRPGPSRAD
jgi:ribonuclease P protein component